MVSALNGILYTSFTHHLSSIPLPLPDHLSPPLAMSSPAVEGETSESTHPVLASLQDKSASPAHLFQALTAVEKALPQLLLCLKPILAQLGSSPNDALRRTSGESSDGRGVGEGEGEEAKRAVVDFLAILDVSVASFCPSLRLLAPVVRRCWM